MFALSVCRILVLLVLLVCAAADASSDVSDSSLLSMVPDCARNCVETFIKSEYSPTQCTSPSNAKCLCRTKTPSGFTLGEAALSCVLSLCSKNVTSDSKAYQMCDSVSGAIPKTHKTITATIFSTMRTSTARETTKTPGARSTTDITLTTDKTTTTDTTTTTRITTTTGRTTTSSTSTAESTSTTSLTTTSSTSTTSSQTSETTPFHSSTSSSEAAPTSTQDPFASSASSGDTNKQGDNSITPASVIGISVGSGVAGSFIVVVAVIFCCKRWRKKRRDHDQPDRNSFEIGGHMDPPAGFGDPTPRPSPVPDIRSRSISNQRNGDQPSRQGNFQPMATLNDQVPYPGSIRDGHQAKRPGEERIGFAISSDTDWESSPHPRSSQHGLVRLVPDEKAKLYPKPLNWGQRPRREGPILEVDDDQQIDNRSKAAMMSTGPGDPRRPEIPVNHHAFKEPTGDTDNQNRSIAPASSPNSTRQAYFPKIQTPVNTYNDPSQRPPLPINPPMIAQPRMFQPQDIKSVDIIKSPHPPKVVTPHRYYPEILQPGPRPLHGALSKSPNPSGPIHHSNKWTPTRNSHASTVLTPARQGDDLFLRVE